MIKIYTVDLTPKALGAAYRLSVTKQLPKSFAKINFKGSKQTNKKIKGKSDSTFFPFHKFTCHAL